MNKKSALLTSAVILLPCVAGIVLWNNLPQQMPIHWGLNGQADGFSNRAFGVFGVPLIFLVFHLICLWFSSCENKKRNQTQKAINITLWIFPVMSLAVGAMTYSFALKLELNINFYITLFIGAIFILMGNYLPKVKQNHLLGIRVKWTLENEENWNKTHRFGGKIFVICGIIIVFTAFFSSDSVWVIRLAVIILSLIIPIIYSYKYKKNNTK